MGRKSSENLLEGIAASKDRGLARLLNGLSIRHVAGRVAAVVRRGLRLDRRDERRRHRTAEKTLSDKLKKKPGRKPSNKPRKGRTKTPGAAPGKTCAVIAESVFDFLHSDFGRRAIDDFRALG